MRIFTSRASSASTNLSWIEVSTRSREPAVQRSPLSEKTPKIAASSACSKSASANTMTGDFPPSSIEQRFNVAAPLRMISRPVAVSPNPCTTWIRW